MNNYDVIIIGGGTAGITVAARIKNKGVFKNIAVIDPSSQHFYQPLWTLVGAGQVKKENTCRAMKEVIPAGVTWIQDAVTKLAPEKNEVHTSKETFSYKYLIVASGIIPDWEFAEGLKEAMGKEGVCSVYDYESSHHPQEILQKLSAGNLLFTMPLGIMKCGGAPQKIMWLMENFCRRQKKRENFNFHFIKEGIGVFAVEKYKLVLDEMVKDRKILTHYKEILHKVDASKKMATFKNFETGEFKDYAYDLLHVVAHFKTHRFVQESPLANANGEVEVDPKTLQSPKFKNVFSLGDCSSCPTGKTGAAIRKQAPVLVENLHDYEAAKPLVHAYNGYTACPILSRHNRVILAEFDYEGKPAESFPFNQAKERFSMYLFKRYLLPWAYWNMMLKGKM
jgi:sulfide:quinone oxidoreductase